jgi:hypothetical protein
MQKTPLSPPRVLTFSEFLLVLNQAFDKEGLRPCILRNYEGFPASNLGNDIDFLIRRSELARVISVLRSIDGLRIIGYVERTNVAHAHVQGVCAIQKSRALQLDFIWSLSWKGQEYLGTDEVLQAAITRQAGALNFLVPSPVHEAIISLLSSLLIGGWMKEKYFPKVHETFAGDKLAVITSLSKAFGLRTATRLVNLIMSADRPRILSCVSSLRTSIALRGLWHRPISSASGVARYYAREFALRYFPKTLEKIYLSGSAGCERAAIIEKLTPMLQHSAVVVEMTHSGPELPADEMPLERILSADPAVEGRNVPKISTAKAVQWLVDEWLSEFKKNRNLTLRISSNRCYDLLIAPQRRIYVGPAWFARLVGGLFPSPVLWLFLDQDVGANQFESQKLSIGKAAKQLETYRLFGNKKCKYVTLNANKPTASLLEDAYAAVIDALEERTNSILDARF